MTTLPPEPHPPRRVYDCSSGETILSSILCLKISAWQDNHMMRWRTADHNCTLTCNYCVEEQSWLCVGRWTSPAITRPNEKAAFNRCFVRLPLLYIMNLTMCIWTPLTGRCLSVGSSVGSSSKCYRIITLVAKLWSFSRVVCELCFTKWKVWTKIKRTKYQTVNYYCYYVFIMLIVRILYTFLWLL